MSAPRRSGSGRSIEALKHRRSEMSTSPTMAPNQVAFHETKKELWTKFLTVPGLILTTVISALVVIGLDKGWSIRGNLYNTINIERATAQIIVQVLSSLLGAIHVKTICQVFNFSSRISMTLRPISLDQLKLWQALSTVNLDWSTRMPPLLLVLLFWLAALAPPALWAGALTPVQTSTIFSDVESVSIPQYSQSSYDYWSQNSFNNTGKSLVSPMGTFTYLPIEERFGYLVQDGSMASSVTGQPLIHLKNDMSNYTFIGRSFGVASSVGLTDNWTKGTHGTTGYKYFETGYYASVECIHNSSSQYGLQILVEGRDEPFWETPFFYLATGPGPNTTRPSNCAANNLTQCGGFVTVGLGGDQDIVAAGWWAAVESGLEMSGLPRSLNYLNQRRPPLSKAITSLTAGSAYQNLNNTQCSISMIPTNFSIYVDIINRTISVNPQNSDNVTDIEPSGFIADSASSILGVMSMVDTTLYSSIIGTMLQRNINNLNQQYGLTNSTIDTTNRGVAESLEVLIDDYLLAIASAQLLVANDTIQVPARVLSHGFNIGQMLYAVVVVVLNSLIVLGFIAEAIRTRLWDHLPKFDYSDITSVVVASSLGGRAVGNAVVNGSSWAGGSLKRAAGTVPVMLRRDDGVVLGLAHAASNQSDSDSEDVEDMYPNDPQGSRHQYHAITDEHQHAATTEDHLLRDWKTTHTW